MRSYRLFTHYASRLAQKCKIYGGGGARCPALKHAYVLPHSRSHGHLPWINALSTTNSSSPRPSPESARRRRSSGSPLPHLVLKPTPGAHPHQHHTITKTEPIRHHPPVTGGESVGPPPCPLSVRRWPHRARSPTIPQQRRIASQSHPLSGERAGRSSVAVLTRRWGRAALESTSAAMHTSLARCSHAAHGRTRAGPWPRLGHVARDPVAGRGWTADRPSAYCRGDRLVDSQKTLSTRPPIVWGGTRSPVCLY